MRTFSKVHGLAGLRLGYGLAHPDTAARIARFAANSNLNVMGLRTAEASLRDDVHRSGSLEANAEDGRSPPMLGHNRLSLGRPGETERFAEVLRTFRRRGRV